MLNNNRLIEIAGQFCLEGRPSEVKALGDGFINDTYTVLLADSPVKYILQRKNTVIFKDIPGMMSNIKAVTEHLKRKIAAAGGASEEEDSRCWRRSDAGVSDCRAGQGRQALL